MSLFLTSYLEKEVYTSETKNIRELEIRNDKKHDNRPCFGTAFLGFLLFHFGNGRKGEFRKGGKECQIAKFDSD